jgi:hypothetical protein
MTSRYTPLCRPYPQEWSKPGFDEGLFLKAPHEMLDGVLAFWRGLADDRDRGRRPPLV